MCVFILYIDVCMNLHVYIYVCIYVCADAGAVKSQQQLSGLLVPISWLLPVTHHELVDIADPRTDKESLESKCKKEGKC